MKLAILLVAAALPLGCLAVAPFRIDVDVITPEPWEVCEALAPAECAAQSDRCSLCKNTFLPDAQLCFEPTIAEALPSFIFECEGGPQPEPPANAADNKKAKPAPWEVCEMYGPGECSDNKDRCSLCENKASGKALCFDPKIASKLPDFIFKCKGASADEGKVLGRRNGPLEETAEADNKKKKSACEPFGPGACADNRDRCSLCKEKMSGVELCFRPSVATKLPPFVFKCSEVKTEEAAANEVAEEADEDNKKAKPAPWEVCEMYGPGECADNKDRCSLCKQKTSGKELCFRPHVAAKLPPFVFKCSEVKTEEADEDSNKAKPAPWEVCETYGPAECGDNKDRCSLCKEKTSGVELCFDPKIASTLPPFIFECSKVKQEAAANEVAEQASEDNKKPKPWEVCEMLKAPACKTAKGCSLCAEEKTGDEMCFSDKIASKLPPFVFKCTKGEEADSANAVVAEEPEAPPKPAPWVPCESFKGPECEAHKECALCTVDTPKRKEKGKLPKEMCFGVDLAKMLPPYVFHCKLPKEDASTVGAEV